MKGLAVVAGQIEINDVVQTDRVSVSFSQGYKIHFGDGNASSSRGNHLCLYPVPERMLLPDTNEAVRTGRTFSLIGNRLGEYETGPQGHPGDGEFDIRPVTSFSMNIEYARNGLNVRVAGATSQGISVCHFAKTIETTGLERWRFRLNLHIPRSAMKDLFVYHNTSPEWVDELLDRRATNWEPMFL